MAINRGSITLHGHGVSLRLQGRDALLTSALRARALMLGWIDGALEAVDLDYAVVETAHGLSLRCNDETVCASLDRVALIEAFDNHATIEMAWRAPDRVFVHAGVVGWRGAAIVVPGRSRSGKTTLVEALVRAGAEYYSDEFAVFDARGHVHPYAIPLAIRTPHGRKVTPVDAIGGRAGTTPLPVARIAITQYHPRARWRPRTVSPAQGMLALMDNTVAAQRPPERTMPILRAAVDGAVIVRSRRGDASAMAQILLAQVQ
jgi:hypothetical protein